MWGAAELSEVAMKQRGSLEDTHPANSIESFACIFIDVSRSYTPSHLYFVLRLAD